MKIFTKILVVCIVIFAFTISIAKSQEFKVIVNSSNSTSSLTKKQVSYYFLKKKTKWSNGVRVIPLDLKSSSSVRKVFTRKIHNKSITQVRAYWQQSVFSGRASPPTEKPNDLAVINYVKSHKGAIGYISKNTKAVGVKTIIVK